MELIVLSLVYSRIFLTYVFEISMDPDCFKLCVEEVTLQEYKNTTHSLSQ